MTNPSDPSHPWNNPSGDGYTQNDQWGPALAFEKNYTSTNRELVLIWFDAREDIHNIKTNIHGMYSVGTNIDIASMTHIVVGANSGSPAGQNVPWDHRLTANNATGGWWDYQALAAEAVNYTFLGAWGGDNRECDASNGCGTGGLAGDGIWSSVVK